MLAIHPCAEKAVWRSTAVQDFALQISSWPNIVGRCLQKRIHPWQLYRESLRYEFLRRGASDRQGRKGMSGAPALEYSCRCERQWLHRRSLSLRRRLKSAHFLRFPETLRAQESSDDLAALNDSPPMEVRFESPQRPVLRMRDAVPALIPFVAIVTPHAHRRYDTII